MATVRIQKFAGEASDAVNAKTFVKQVKFVCLGQKSQWGAEDPEWEEYRAVVLLSNLVTGSQAQRWAASLDDTIKNDYNNLSKALIKRFPKEEVIKDTRMKVYKEMAEVKQRSDESLTDYIERFRSFLHRLDTIAPADRHDAEAIEAMIDGLINDTSAALVGGLLAKEIEPTFEDAVDMLRGTTRRQEKAKTTFSTTSTLVDDSELEAKDKAFIQLLTNMESRQAESQKRQIDMIQQQMANLSLSGNGGRRYNNLNANATGNQGRMQTNTIPYNEPFLFLAPTGPTPGGLAY